MTKHVFVTGGVVSSLGKGITAASLGRLLKSRGYKVTMQKADPYLNVDPGTMSPFQHGEVFVTEDGYESDLDLGHYERFIDENLTRDSNFTTGAIYKSLIARGHHRAGWHDWRHRVAAVCGGYPPVPQGGRSRERLLHPRIARPLYRRRS